MPDYLRPQYSNHINVNHTPWDFRLVFSVLRAPLAGDELDQIGDTIRPEAVADILIPANLIHGLIGALQTNFDRYIEAYGAPGLNPEGPEDRSGGDGDDDN